VRTTSEGRRSAPYGVGVIGAGPGVAALHLPTLSRLPEHFDVVHVSDGGSGRAAALVARSGARASTGVDELLADPRVEVVAICSPPDQHAAHIVASVTAHKRAIFCEKPIATTVKDAEAVVDLCRKAGVALVVGTNHLFDVAWGRAKHFLVASGHPVSSISVTVAIPPNGRYHDTVTETDGGLPAAGRRPDLADPAVAASVVRQLVSGLAVHDLPILRDLAPSFERIVYARAIEPVGYALAFVASGIPITLTTVMLAGGADALWRLSISTAVDRIDVSFPPSFTHAGSATVRVHTPDGRATTYARAADDGYLAEWRAMAELIAGTDAVEYDELAEDARYGLRLADAAADAVLRGQSL
jgi:predicted dehydrogenase